MFYLGGRNGCIFLSTTCFCKINSLTTHLTYFKWIYQGRTHFHVTISQSPNDVDVSRIVRTSGIRLYHCAPRSYTICSWEDVKDQRGCYGSNSFILSGHSIVRYSSYDVTPRIELYTRISKRITYIQNDGMNE